MVNVVFKSENTLTGKKKVTKNVRETIPLRNLNHNATL
jgi:hypothetical protein